MTKFNICDINKLVIKLNYYDFSKYIKYLRIKKGLKQKDLATILGISTSKYCKIENGSTEPSFNELLILLELFNIDILKLNKMIKNKTVFFD